MIYLLLLERIETYNILNKIKLKINNPKNVNRILNKKDLILSILQIITYTEIITILKLPPKKINKVIYKF